MKSVLLCSIPKYDLVAPPAAIGILKGVAEDHGLNAVTLDFNLSLYKNLSKTEWQELDNWCVFINHDITEQLKGKILKLWDKEIQANIPDSCEYVLISVFSYWSLYIARLLIEHEGKKLKPYKLIVGGNGVSSQFPDTKKYFKEWNDEGNYIEHLILGEGETPLSKIFGNGKTMYDDSNLDSYPFPSYSSFNLNDYEEKKVYITGSRGCVRKCTFCDIENIWPTFRYRSAKSLIEEIKKHYYENGVIRFDFTDSLINGSVSNFFKFNELLANEKEKNSDLKDVGYLGQFICRPKQQMPPAHYEAMHYAGCRQITVGIESFSNNVRNHMKKKFSDEDIQYHFEQCKYWSIPNVLLMIVCYPTETLEDHKKNIQDLIKYQDYSKFGVIELIRWGTTMHLIPDTPITSEKNIKELGLKGRNNDTIFFDPYSQYTWLSETNPTLDVKERIRRRLELHEWTVKLGYLQPAAEYELQTLLEMSKTII